MVVERIDCTYYGTMSGLYRLKCRVDYRYCCRMSYVYYISCREYIVLILVDWVVCTDCGWESRL